MHPMTWSLVAALWVERVVSATCPNKTASPLAVPIRDTQVDPSIANSTMRGIPAKIGTPPQDIVMIPWPDLNNTYIYDAQSPCNPNVVANDVVCRIRRGGEYQEANSSSFAKSSDLVAAGGATQEITTRGSEAGVPKLISTSLAGTEVLQVNGTNATAFPIGIPRQIWDNGYTTLHVLGLGSNSTYLDALVRAGQIPGRAWSVFWGRMWTGSSATDMDGSLVLGGYDEEKVIGRNFTQPLDYSEETGCWTGMKVTVSDMVLNFRNGTDASIMPHNSAVQCCIVPQRQLLWEAPTDIVGQFEEATGTVDAGYSLGLNRDARLINMTATPNIFDGDVTFVLSSGLQVRVPNDQFIVPHADFLDSGERSVNQSQKEILIAPVDSNPATLGRAFFTAAYLLVDHDDRSFTLWQANPTTRSKLVAAPGSSSGKAAGCGGVGGGQGDAGDGSGAGSNKDATIQGRGVSAGVIAGAAVGGAAVLAGIVALVFFLRRRRKRNREGEMAPAGPLPQPDRARGSAEGAVPGSMPKLAEMRADEYHRPQEVHGESLAPPGAGLQETGRPLTFELDAAEQRR
ncbi:uncharacterized protein THITE_2148504 [Thermothielavioides terrestris NRRL 8126]|uniref:Peptidase A1 domain-containing protein n=1 Tax=Thermothielavioides terrestris (strain ATCC 38088 / NRRL 8126) TaxID=578455 RepID=G2RGU9_THETT|nr:uncharacterized protein THITE_2148504 [Thermothielavioides terrestris NRRL 8126]AEO71934.1 hypothetical protein THITE_2148504 [Thermothielavioides terrestris NRRL 8126]